MELKAEHEKIINQKNRKISESEQRTVQKEAKLSQMLEEQRKKERALEQSMADNEKLSEKLERKNEELERLHNSQVEKLEEISGFSAERAKEELFNILKEEAAFQRDAAYTGDYRRGQAHSQERSQKDSDTDDTAHSYRRML